MLGKTSWKAVLGRDYLCGWVWGFCMLEYLGGKRGFFLMLFFFHIGLEFSWEDCLLLDPQLCPNPQGDTRGWGLPPRCPHPAHQPGHPGELHRSLAWDLRMFLGPQETRGLLWSWQDVHCVNETRWEDEHILHRLRAVFPWANWMWIKTGPGKPLLVRGEAAC